MSAWDDLGTRDTTQSVAAALQVKLDSKIQTLCDIHNRKLSDEARRHWLKRLLPYATGQALWVALDDACDERVMPSVGWVFEQITINARRDTKPAPTQPTQTPEESERAARAAIKSMLWLHYKHGFEAKHVGGIIGIAAAQLFERQTGRTVAESIEDAKLLPGHDRESIIAWMIEEESKGH